jgi:PleD family two-component response regulator
MPEMDGFELARRIRMDKKYKDTPIMFLTGNSSRDRIVKAIKLGISDFIVKPAYNETLLVKVRRYLEQ